MVVARCTARLEEASIASRRVESELQARIDDLHGQVEAWPNVRLRLFTMQSIGFIYLLYTVHAAESRVVCLKL